MREGLGRDGLQYAAVPTGAGMSLTPWPPDPLAKPGPAQRYNDNDYQYHIVQER